MQSEASSRFEGVMSREVHVELDFLFRILTSGSERGKYFYGERGFSKEIADNSRLEMKFHSDGRSVICHCARWPMPREVFEELNTTRDSRNLSPMVVKYVENTCAKVRKAAEHLLALIKYKLNNRNIETDLVSSVWRRWRLDGDQRDFPEFGSVVIEWVGVRALNDAAHEHLQRSLDENVLPLRAFVHLHRAFEERIPSHRWIEATIAAELAVKEVLCIARPEVELLLLECPSPPLRKLYGDLLEEYMGEQSPYKSALHKGAETRNRLLHRHTKVEITSGDASKYVQTVNSAIAHLLRLLYPSDPVWGERQID